MNGATLYTTEETMVVKRAEAKNEILEKVTPTVFRTNFLDLDFHIFLVMGVWAAVSLQIVS